MVWRQDLVSGCLPLNWIIARRWLCIWHKCVCVFCLCVLCVDDCSVYCVCVCVCHYVCMCVYLCMYVHHVCAICGDGSVYSVCVYNLCAIVCMCMFHCVFVLCVCVCVYVPWYPQEFILWSVQLFAPHIRPLSPPKGHRGRPRYPRV